MIGDATHSLFGLDEDSTSEDNEKGPGGQVRNNDDEAALCSTLKLFNVFVPNVHPNFLQIVATKDLATYEIQESLLNAKQFGQDQLETNL